MNAPATGSKLQIFPENWINPAKPNLPFAARITFVNWPLKATTLPKPSNGCLKPSKLPQTTPDPGWPWRKRGSEGQ
jgi:hypothetical protein